MDEPTISPAGDPFHASPNQDDQDERPHACIDGWVTLGQIALDPETGEEVEELRVARTASESFHVNEYPDLEDEDFEDITF